MNIHTNFRHFVKKYRHELIGIGLGFGLNLTIIVVGPVLVARVWPVAPEFQTSSQLLTIEDVRRTEAQRRQHARGVQAFQNKHLIANFAETLPLAIVSTNTLHLSPLESATPIETKALSSTSEVAPASAESSSAVSASSVSSSSLSRSSETPVSSSSSSAERSSAEAIVPPTATSSVSSSRSSTTSSSTEFPALDRAIMPVSTIPQWGEMTTAAQWDAPYSDMKKRSDIHFGPVPPYNRAVLITPMSELLNPRDSAAITQKLFYSTRFMGEYDLDSDEHSGTHVGIDLKLPLGQGFGSIAGGRVHSVSTNDRLGLHIIIEHRAPNGNTYYSIYGHCGSVAVRAGQEVTPGEYIGTVGMTGQTSAPHLHLQVDSGTPGEVNHVPYSTSTPGDISQYSIDPLQFIRQY